MHIAKRGVRHAPTRQMSPAPLGRTVMGRLVTKLRHVCQVRSLDVDYVAMRRCTARDLRHVRRTHQLADSRADEPVRLRLLDHAVRDAVLHAGGTRGSGTSARARGDVSTHGWCVAQVGLAGTGPLVAGNVMGTIIMNVQQ